jgi:hypothetical protein
VAAHHGKKQLSQLISLLVASTAAQGLLINPAFAVPGVITIDSAQSSMQVAGTIPEIHITNTGSLTGSPTTAFTLSQGGTLTSLTNDGTISDLNDNLPDSANSSIVQIDGSIDTFTNNGLITSTDLYNYGDIVSIGASGSVDTFINNGTIQNNPNGYNFGMVNAGAVDNQGHIHQLTNTTDAVISGYLGINNQGTIDNITNNGLIISNNASFMPMPGQNGAINNNGIIGTLYNSGTISNGISGFFDAGAVINWGTIHNIVNDNVISGSNYGISNYGYIDTIENNGQISSNSSGIYANTSGTEVVSNIINNGTISGGFSGIYLSSYSSQNLETSIVNNGTLTGSGYALYIYNDTNASSSITLTNSGVVSGDIYSSGSMPLVINGGTGTTGTLTGLTGIGNISSTRSDVVFGSGSLLLNDNVSTGRVLNDTASLQVNNNINITGDYHQNAAATLISGISDLVAADGNAQSDFGYGRLNVSGNATIDAGSSVNLLRTGNTYNFAEGQRYVVVTAGGASTNFNADQLNYKAVGYTEQ